MGLKYILANYNVGTDPKAVNSHLRQALKRAVIAGAIKNTKGTVGASGSFRLGESKPKKTEKVAKIAKIAKVAKKVAASPKKVAAKKVAASPRKWPPPRRPSPVAKKVTAAKKASV